MRSERILCDRCGGPIDHDTNRLTLGIESPDITAHLFIGRNDNGCYNTYALSNRLDFCSPECVANYFGANSNEVE